MHLRRVAKNVYNQHKRFLHYLPPRWGGNTHISHESVPKSRFMTASPSREKPLAGDCTCFNRRNCVRSRTRLLPSGRHPRVASLAPSGQFTFSCQPPALRNRGLTDVGHRRRRQRYPFPCCVDLGRNENILDIFRAHRTVWGTPRERCPYKGICNLPQRSTPSVEKSPQIVNFWWICFIRFEIFV